MPDEVITPAGTADGAAESVAETPTTEAAPVESAAEGAKVETAPAAEKASKPDLEALLADEEIARQIRERVAAEADHRFKSERGRVRAEIEAEYRQRQEAAQAAEQARRERERLKGMDPYELGEQRKRELEEQEQQEAVQQRIAAMRGDYELSLLSQTGREIFASVYELAKDEGLSEEELNKLSPASYPSLGGYVKGVIDLLKTTSAKKLAKEMAKELAKVEAKAMVEEQAAQARDSSPAPEVLPPAGPGQTDSDFMAAYASGSNSDHGRMFRRLKEWGLA